MSRLLDDRGSVTGFVAVVAFALVVPIYPKAYREKVGAEGYAKAPVGAGPYKITKVEPGVFQVLLSYGFMEEPDVPAALSALDVRGLDFDPDDATYFIGRESVVIRMTFFRSVAGSSKISMVLS